MWNTSRPAGCAENAGDPSESCSRRAVTLSPKAQASRPSARASAQRAFASPPAPGSLVPTRRMGLAVVELGVATCLSENVMTWCVLGSSQKYLSIVLQNADELGMGQTKPSPSPILVPFLARNLNVET